MKFTWTVHRAHETTLTEVVDVKGAKVSAVIPAFEVELVSDDPRCGTYTHRFIGSELEEAKKTFKAGESVTFEM